MGFGRVFSGPRLRQVGTVVPDPALLTDLFAYPGFAGGIFVGERPRARGVRLTD